MTTKNQTDANGNILSGTSVELLEIPVSYADFALAAGLPHDAVKSDVLAAMGKAKAEHAKVLDLVGAKSADEAIGKITGERATHGELVKAIVGDDEKNPTTESALKKLGADRKIAERTTAEQMLGEAKAQGKSAGDKAMGIFEKHGMAAFHAHLDALPVHAALAGTVPQQKPSSENPAQPSGNAANGEIKVTLSADDEKLIKSHGLDREKFVAKKRDQLAEQQAFRDLQS